ncbi:hypothetical protein KY331_05905 [Candidatus Woesearchaeota archaeon]|nr:hypothetical protein [Candidatus Woesearchaeota archaeon]
MKQIVLILMFTILLASAVVADPVLVDLEMNIDTDGDGDPNVKAEKGGIEGNQVGEPDPSGHINIELVATEFDTSDPVTGDPSTTAVELVEGVLKPKVDYGGEPPTLPEIEVSTIIITVDGNEYELTSIPIDIDCVDWSCFEEDLELAKVGGGAPMYMTRWQIVLNPTDFEDPPEPPEPEVPEFNRLGAIIALLVISGITLFILKRRTKS